MSEEATTSGTETTGEVTTELETGTNLGTAEEAGTNLIVYLSGTAGLWTTGGGLEKEKRNTRRKKAPSRSPSSSASSYLPPFPLGPPSTPSRPPMYSVSSHDEYKLVEAYQPVRSHSV